MSQPPRAVARGVSILVPAVAAAIGLFAHHDLLGGGVAWLLFLVCAVAGSGHLVEIMTRARVDLGLRLAWGAALLLAACGWFLAVGLCNRAVLLGLLALGYGGYVWRQLTVAEPVATALARGAAALRRDPQAAVLWGALVALTAINVFAAVAHVTGNPYDDDIAYTPLVRRLLETGDLIEPFSFRRLSAYGGQTILSALGAARGTLGNQFLVDQGLFLLITLALLVGLLRRQRRFDPFVAGLVLLVVLLLPDASTNAGSYWSGAALFLALYRTATQVDELPRLGFAIMGLLAAAVATLRQNYLPVAVLFPALFLLFRLRRRWSPSLRAELPAWRDVVIAGAITLLPYWIASWRSCATVLYPIQVGTGNPYLVTSPQVWTFWQEVQFFLRIALDPNPVRVMVPLLPIALACRDPRRGAPLFAFAVACAAGFLFLVHGFSTSDERNLWRYAFASMTVLALVISIEIAGRGLGRDDGEDGDGDRRWVDAPAAARVIVVVCLLGQFVYTAKSVYTSYRKLAANVALSARAPLESSLADARYRRLQAAIPAGAPIAILVDEPARLDYARNPIVNLDTPGLASRPPGLPMFVGAEAKAAYLRGQKLRYLAFVRSEASSYFYRRGLWLERLAFEVELWRVTAAYLLDTIDSFAQLAATYPVIFDEEGLVVVDLGSQGPTSAEVVRRDEPVARERFVADLFAHEGQLDRWRLTSRTGLVFEDGWSRPVLIAHDDDGGWSERPPATAPRDALPVRWIFGASHLRLRGTGGSMVLAIRGRALVAELFHRPRVSLVVAGKELASRLVDEDGRFGFEVTIPAAPRSWIDAYLDLSSVGEDRRDPTKWRAAWVESVTWEPTP